jgi:hypothetical protein
MAKHAEHFKASRLKEGEEFVTSIEGYIGKMFGKGKDIQHNGELILTNTRVAFMAKTWLKEEFRVIPLERISSVDFSSGLMAKSITFVSNNDFIEFTTAVKVETLNDFHAKVEDLRDKITPANNQSQQTVDIPAQIKKLAELKDSGIITNEEFEQKKSELLSKM